jgi:carbon-monoxide dehydrogenase medium subunit
MTLSPFELHRPTTRDEAVEMMARYGDTAAYYCGGTELLLAMKLGFAQYEHLISVREIPDLQDVRVEDGVLCIGAAVTHRQVERSPVVRAHCPALAEMASQVANIRVRSAGTLGGNLCFADPHSDPGTFLLALGADLVCHHGDETRTVPLESFLLGPYQTVLAEGELLGEIRIPPLPEGAVVVHRKLSFRERPAATVTCLVRVDGGVVADVRLAVGSVGFVPVRVHEGERLLMGVAADSPNGAVDAAAEAAGVAAEAVEDANGSAEYKENLVRVLVKRCFAAALQEATA